MPEVEERYRYPDFGPSMLGLEIDEMFSMEGNTGTMKNLFWRHKKKFPEKFFKHFIFDSKIYVIRLS